MKSSLLVAAMASLFMLPASVDTSPRKKKLDKLGDDLRPNQEPFSKEELETLSAIPTLKEKKKYSKALKEKYAEMRREKL